MELLYLSAFAASFIFIFLKAFQQLNVVHSNWWWVVPTSMAMAFVEVYVVASIATTGWGLEIVLAIGLGSGLGAIASMFIHKKLVRG